MREDDLVRLRHMIEAAQQAAQFVSGRQREDLDADRMLLFAVVRAIEIIGEAASQLSAETRALSPEIPWKAIIGMRNRIIHAYWDMDTGIVWKTVTERIPALLPMIQRLVARAPEDI